MNDILQSPDKRLHAVSTKVINFDEAKKIAQQLIDVTRGVDKPFNFWLGMAAPQVGYDKRIVILRKSYQNYTVMVNPEIVDKKWFLPSVERCYSLKGMGRFLLKRYFWLRIKYQDLEGKYHEGNIVGLRAYTMQQEMDHINGVLISDIGIRIL